MGTNFGYGLKQFGIFNAQHFMNLFPKVAKINRKKLFTSLSNFDILVLMNRVTARNVDFLFMAYLFSTLY